MKKKYNQLSEDTTQVILESISDGVFTINYNWEITSFNRAAAEITGISSKDAIGRRCWEVFRSNMCEQDCALKKTMEEGKPFVNSSGYIISSEKKKIPVTVSTSLLIDKNGKILGGVETFRDHSLVEELRKELSARFKIDDIVSNSESMKTIFKILPQVAESESSVLIEGETGTGKELLARAIHNISPRKKKPFIAINCGALPDTLLESELFGYKKGAFTHAIKDKPGKFALADGGTLFLDEIGDTSSAFQVSLLRVLQEHEFTALGALKKEKTNVRIIAATNKSLSGLIANEQFRQDLYYRINVIRFLLPPLRQRKEDIPLLVDKFIRKLNIRLGKSVHGVDPEVLQTLMSLDYQGNIRELENIIEHAFVLCLEGNINLQHLPDFLYPGSSPVVFEDEDPVKTARIKQIHDALIRNNFNRNAAAKELGIHKSTLFRQIKKFGIKIEEKRSAQ
ncbi:MAG: sigma 54-interacting transcriptional regulator [Desulfobacula sp.]|jgi:PAS domain S-box-containing protein|uniref:sigma-54 interaction domain-containing protein n=1 Tax=Desulfobacula sp. TaxID=2593537 RepID=UPI001EB2C12E|nr:sigma 54-interacting transcriptional regulator [Desulfobacula sp.]MBT3487991.1 sigma 54-interacting transcriptional regulator [Desulfobacula sp.]